MQLLLSQINILSINLLSLVGKGFTTGVMILVL